MYRSILVPLDGSAFSEHAVPLALGIARRANATVQLVHVHQPVAMAYAESPVAFDEAWDTHLKEQEKAHLEDVARRAAGASALPLTITLLEGEVTSSLRAASATADLVVMTTHGRGPFARFWMGSVTDDLLRELTVPVLLVHPEDKPADLTTDRVFRRLLLPLDGSPLAEQVLEPAVALGSLMQANYTLLRVVRPATPGPVLPEGVFVPPSQAVLNQAETIQEQLMKEARHYLEGVAQGLRQRGLAVRTRVVAETNPAVAIIDTIAEEGADLVAIETHGRRGLARMFLGSVADKVVRGSTVPVLVHRPVFQ